MKKLLTILFVFVCFVSSAQYTNRDKWSIWHGEMVIGSQVRPYGGIHLMLGDSAGSKSFLPPRVNGNASITSPRDGMFHYDVVNQKFYGRINGEWLPFLDSTQSAGGISDGDKGDVTVSGSGATWTIDNGVVTFAKMQAITDGRLLGAEGGTAIEEITLTATDFNLATNTLSIDYANGQAASGSTKGFLTAADWTTFNSKIGGSGANTRITLWNGTGTVTSSASFTYATGSWPGITIGTSGDIYGSLAIRANDGTNTLITGDAGLSLYGNSGYKQINFLSYAGGNTMATFRDVGSGVHAYSFLNGKAGFNYLTQGTSDGTVEITGSVGDSTTTATAGNVHSFRGISRVYSNTSSGNIFYGTVHLANTNSSNVNDHGSVFQSDFKKTGSQTVNHLYHHDMLGDSIISGVVHNRSGIEMWDAVVLPSAQLGVQFALKAHKFRSAISNWGFIIDSAQNTILDGNFLIGDSSIATDARKTIHFFNGVAPSSNISGAIVWAESGELYARDGSGNVVLLTGGGSSYTFTQPLNESGGTVDLGGLSGYGSSGQLVRSTGSGWEYFTPSYLTSVPLNTIIAATGTNSINNAGYGQVWSWNSLSSGAGLTLVSSATSATAAQGHAILSLGLNGAHSNSDVTTWTQTITNFHTGTNSTNVALKLYAAGATNNYALIIPADSGRVGFGTITPHASALLDMTSTARGLLTPRMNTTQQDAISSPATGLLIYNTDSSLFRYYNGSAWASIAAGSGGGGATTWNGIGAPTGDQALTFDAGESSTWTNSNTTEDLFTVNSSTVTTSSFFSYNRTSTALAAGNNIMELVSSGANGSSSITATGLRISVTNTGTTSTNVGLDVTASGATTNTAINASGSIVTDASLYLPQSTTHGLRFNGVLTMYTQSAYARINPPSGSLYVWNDAQNSRIGVFNTGASQGIYIEATSTGHDINSAGSVNVSMQASSGNKVTIGQAASSAAGKFSVLATTEQMRILYDASNYYTTTVSSAGGVTFNAVGSGARFTFSDLINIPTGTPSSASDTGTTGDIKWDADYIYICTATNTWKRVAIATW